jgi:AcrR family transcriptional regulator
MPGNETRREKKEKILQAALEAYARYGIADATTRQIAEIAGTGKSTLFEYFKSSGDLMDAAFAFYIGQASAQWERFRKLADADPAAALAGYYDSLTDLILRQPEKLLLISQYATAILAGGKDFAEVKRQYAGKLQSSADALLQQFRHIVSTGIRSGAFRPAGGAAEEDCALVLNAIAREMQAQAFVQDESEIRDTCLRLKHMALRLLGANPQ